MGEESRWRCRTIICEDPKKAIVSIHHRTERNMMTSQALTCRDYESGVLSQCRLLVKCNPLTCTCFLVQRVKQCHTRGSLRRSVSFGPVEIRSVVSIRIAVRVVYVGPDFSRPESRRNLTGNFGLKFLDRVVGIFSHRLYVCTFLSRTSFLVAFLAPLP